MRGHFRDVKRLMEKGVHSDSYARHFAGIWPRGAEIPSPGMQHNLIKCEILWQGNPISAVKTFGKNICSLCNREWMEIIKISRSNPDILINSCLEIHGACHHKPRFHRYHEQETPSADDCKKREKVALEAPNPRRRRINLIDPDGNESVGSHSQNGRESYGLVSVWLFESSRLPSGRANEEETVWKFSQPTGFSEFENRILVAPNLRSHFTLFLIVIHMISLLYSVRWVH